MKALIPAFLVACTNTVHGGLQIVEAPAGTSDVAALVRQTMERVEASHRRLVVYVGATWCEPCQQIHAAAVAHRLDGEFPDLSLLEFDLDRDEAALTQAGYTSKLIPLFVVPNSDGTAGPHRISGGVHDGDNVKLLSAELHRMLDGS